MNARLAWLGIALTPAVWRHTRALDCEKAVQLFASSTRAVAHLIGVDNATAEKIRRALVELNIEREEKRLKTQGISVVTRADKDYPASLHDIYDPPAGLFYRGELVRDRPRIAIVGARRATASGIQTANDIGRELAAAGLEVVSGLARGIDAAAHRGAISQGRTIAVLGSGHGDLYPPEHRQLSKEITTAGAVITEYPFETPPRALNFPARNRIISGLASAVVVVEAGKKSGALITVDFALEQGKDVFAVPGPVRSPASAGCHILLQQGAGLVTGAADILAALAWNGPAPAALRSSTEVLTPAQAELLESLAFEPIAADAIIARATSSAQNVLGDLAVLEIEGFVARQAGGHYCRLK